MRRRIPAWVWAIALFAAMLHMAPYWRAESETPAGWRFMANLSSSPDYMQYRVWMRQTAVEGPLVTNTFTPEANRAYLPVGIYWFIGAASRALGITPEWGYAWLGAFVAVAFVVVLWIAIRRFVAHAVAARWAFGIVMLGGGLGGYVVMLEGWARARQSSVLQATILTPFGPEGGATLFERFRGSYAFQALFDTHFLVFWLITLVAVLSLHTTLGNMSPRRVLATGAIFAFGTLLHVYEGITLVVITVLVIALALARGVVARRTALITGGTCCAAVAIVLVPLLYLASTSGLPAPDWRGNNALFLVVVISYPLAFAMALVGFGRYWRRATMDDVFVVGWAAGGLVILLSGPVFPYPYRGTMTLAIPLAIISVLIWFATRSRVSAPQALLVVLLLGATPVSIIRSMERRTTFRDVDFHKWTNADHDRVIATLGARAERGDVLVADDATLRWLAPSYPGVHYAGHFFLTPSYATRHADVSRFLRGASVAERNAFLARSRARWIFVPAAFEASGIASIDGVTVVERTAVGTLLEVARGSVR